MMEYFIRGCALLPMVVACHSQPAEPAPPAANHELAVAPPGARGARAAGTDAAPPQLGEDPGEAAPDPTPSEEKDETDGGTGSAGGAGAGTDAGPGVAL